MSWAILEITDGTKAGTIDLLATNGGFLLADWRPAIQIPKSGGIWNGSPLTDGRRLALRNYENAIEVFNVTASRGSQDEIIHAMQNLFRLLDKAVNYWVTDWQTCPVYIKAKATHESNARYALIMDYRIGGLNNPYGQPFFACPSIEDELALTIERDYWTEQPPGTATAIEISAQQAYNGVTYGQEATDANQVFISNKGPMANITHVYLYDNTAGTYTNMLGAGLPHNLFPIPADNNDILYIGSNNAVANSGPFSSVVFDITTAALNINDITWEYADSGLGWTAIPNLTDEADDFTTTGIKYLNFEPPDSWAASAVNGITGWWIRGLPDFAAGGVPQQGNREVYSVVTPFIEIDALQASGDIPALSKIIAENCYGFGTVAGTPYMDLIVGLRSLSRGQSFTPYINLTNEQNNAGITITVGTDVALSIVEFQAPAGSAYHWTPTTDADAVRLTISFGNALLQEYIGKYNVYLRVRIDDASADSFVYMKTRVTSDAGNSAFDLYTGQIVQLVNAADTGDFSLGQITIPNIEASSFQIQIFGYDNDVSSDVGDVYFYDLILIPVDEFSSKYHIEFSGYPLQIGDYIIVDSIEKPKEFHYAELRDSNDYLKAHASVNGAGQSILQANADQRLWFYIFNFITKAGSGYHNITKVQLSRMARYIAMRGNR